MTDLTDLIDKKGSCSIPVRGRADVWTFYLRRWGNHFFRSDAGAKIELWGLDEEAENYLKGLKYGQRFVERVEGNTVHFDKIKEQSRQIAGNEKRTRDKSIIGTKLPLIGRNKL